ncbi:hypothetical protein BKI52_09990 [marine bacterium AO1-C]|nr:hypothetical protein BKI52_09990 [marine bacterium AO1-C]
MQDIKQNITLNITLEEANLLLEALGEMPFKRVFGLVGKIQNQAAPQVNGQNGQDNHQNVISQKQEEVNV